MWYLVAGVGWFVLRRLQGRALLPEFVMDFLNGDPFANGAVLVKTEEGTYAVPCNTPAMHPAAAAAEGLLSPQCTLAIARALAPIAPAPGLSNKNSGSAERHAAMMGNFDMFDPFNGVGPNYEFPDDIDVPRSTSMSRIEFNAR